MDQDTEWIRTLSPLLVTYIIFTVWVRSFAGAVQANKILVVLVLGVQWLLVLYSGSGGRILYIDAYVYSILFTGFRDVYSQGSRCTKTQGTCRCHSHSGSVAWCIVRRGHGHRGSAGNRPGTCLPARHSHPYMSHRHTEPADPHNPGNSGFRACKK